MHCFIDRQIMLHSTLSKLLGHPVFMVRSGIGRVPKRLVKTLGHFRVPCKPGRLPLLPPCALPARLQLRPVTYRALCGLTPLDLTNYSRNDAYFTRPASCSDA